MTSQNSPPDSSLKTRLVPLLNDTELAARQKRFRRSRRLTGMLVGMLMGMVYTAVSQNVNAYLLPGLTLYQTPPGQPWTILLGGLAGGLIGWITFWSEGSWIGIIWGSLLAAVFFDGYALLNSVSGSVPLSTIAFTLFLIILPVTAMAAVAVGIFRWSLERQQAAWQDHRSILVVAGIPILLLLAVAWLGWTAQYPDYGRAVLVRAADLIHAGQVAAQQKDLPEPLAVEAVDNFIVNGRGAYTLEWNKDPNNRFAIPRPANTGGLESLAIARFKNGWILICLYPGPDIQPECVSRWKDGG